MLTLYNMQNIMFSISIEFCLVSKYIAVDKRFFSLCIVFNYITRLHHFSGTFTLQFLEGWDVLCFLCH